MRQNKRTEDKIKTRSKQIKNKQTQARDQTQQQHASKRSNTQHNRETPRSNTTDERARKDRQKTLLSAALATCKALPARCTPVDISW